jgi:diguanylate cyclase (GGDEF)-like protein
VTHPFDLLTISGEPQPDHRAARFPRLVSPKLSARLACDSTDALHDPLTHLANGSSLVHQLEQAAQESGKTVAVLFVNIDRFRTINATYGRRAGDMLLKALAGRLARLVQPQDTLARLENDTFILICRHLDDGEAESRISRIHLVSNGVFGIFETKLLVSCTVGPLFTGSAEDIPPHLLDRTGTAIDEARADRIADSEIIDLIAMSESMNPSAEDVNNN